jgi:hypothetical protein
MSPGRDLNSGPPEHKDSHQLGLLFYKNEEDYVTFEFFIFIVEGTSTLKMEASSCTKTTIRTAENVTKYLRLNIYIAY